MPVEVAKPLGLMPFVQEAMKQKTSLGQGMGIPLEKIRRDTEIREVAHPVGFFGVQPVILPRPPKFSDSFDHKASTLGDRLKAMLEQSTPALKESFWLWDASTDASTNDAESNADSDCEDEEKEEVEQEEQDEKEDEVKSQYDAAEEKEDEAKLEYDAAKAEVIKQVVANDPNTPRLAAMEAVHQPVPGAKSGREKASMKEYLNYGQSFVLDVFRKSSSNNKESISTL